MHQLGHSRAHSMQEVQFSSISAITPRLRGGNSGRTSGYCSVTDRRAKVLAVTFRPSTSPLPGNPTLHLPSGNPASPTPSEARVPLTPERSEGSPPAPSEARVVL